MLDADTMSKMVTSKTGVDKNYWQLKYGLIVYVHSCTIYLPWKKVNIMDALNNQTDSLFPTRNDLENQLMLQHPVRGRMEQEYESYVAAAEDLGWNVKTFDEWLDS